jgi:serine/threonine-protein kinase
LLFRQLLNHFVAACNAVAYAHSRGVIHRDLKPSNILLGKYGETLVVDWGLAKVVGRTEVTRTDSEQTLTTPPSNPGDATQLGQAVGTPSYMSPEQAAGRWDVVGPGTDIYSLGATLYYLLTAHLPYAGRNTPEVLAQVQRGRLPPPRQLNAEVPRALEAICQKAMAVDAEDRYATATALAADLEHWLADEPVTAYHEPLATRLARWGRRHKTWVLAGTAVLLACLAALVAAVVASERGRRHVIREQAETEKARQEAVASEEKARRYEKDAFASARKYFITLADDEDLKAVGVEKLRKKLLTEGRDYFQAFVRQRGDDPSLKSELADAHAALGRLNADIGDEQEAIAEYQQAIALFEQLAEAHPDVRRYQHNLAANCNNLASTYGRLDQRKEAEAAHEKTLALYQALVERYPDDLGIRKDLAGSHINLGVLYSDTGRRRDAETAYQKARALLQPLTDRDPTNPDYQRLLAISHNNLGFLYLRMGRFAEAETTLQEAFALRQQLADQHPNVPRYRSELARTLSNLGRLYNDTERFSDAEAAYNRALALRQQLVEQHPVVASFRSDLAANHGSLAALYQHTDRPREAEAAFQKALAFQRQLAEQHPAVPFFRSEEAGTLNNLALLYADTGRLSEAEAAYDKVRALLQELTDQHPSVTRYAAHLGAVLGNLGNLASDTDRPQAALDFYARAIATLEDLLRRVEHDASARRFLRNAYRARAETLMRLGQPAEATPDVERALVLDQGPDLSETRLLQASNWAHLGEHAKAAAAVEEILKPGHLGGDLLCEAACVYGRSAAAVGAGSLAERYAARAVELLRQAVAKGYKDAAYVKKNADLDSLRQREDYRKLLADLEPTK